MMKKTFEITGVIQNYEGSRWMMKPEISPLPSKEKRYTNTTRYQSSTSGCSKRISKMENQ